MMRARLLLLVCSVGFLLPPNALGQVAVDRDSLDLTLSYQGFLRARNGTPINRTMDITFRLYDTATARRAPWWRGPPLASLLLLAPPPCISYLYCMQFLAVALPSLCIHVDFFSASSALADFEA